MSPHAAITLESLHGPDIEPYLDDIARLRIRVFREWPYLYEGDAAYEADYLRTYTQASRSIAVADTTNSRSSISICSDT